MENKEDILDYFQHQFNLLKSEIENFPEYEEEIKEKLRKQL